MFILIFHNTLKQTDGDWILPASLTQYAFIQHLPRTNNETKACYCYIIVFIHYKPRIAANSRLVEDENDLKWVENGKIFYILYFYF